MAAASSGDHSTREGRVAAAEKYRAGAGNPPAGGESSRLGQSAAPLCRVAPFLLDVEARISVSGSMGVPAFGAQPRTVGLTVVRPGLIEISRDEGVKDGAPFECRPLQAKAAPLRMGDRCSLPNTEKTH